MIQDLEKIKKLIDSFFKKAGFGVDIEIKTGQIDENKISAESSAFLKESESKNEIVLANIKSEEPKILIGQNGQTLFEIQHLLRAILKKQISERIFLDIDIENYKKKKREYLKETARSLADEVFLSKKEKALNPMPAYERRIIHLELAGRSDVITESEGQGGKRRVIIKPVRE